MTDEPGEGFDALAHSGSILGGSRNKTQSIRMKKMIMYYLLHQRIAVLRMVIQKKKKLITCYQKALEK